MPRSPEAATDRRATILAAAIPVFGRFGFKKTSMDELAAAASLSKPGLYLHFTDKQELFVAAMQKYLDDGLALVRQELARPREPLQSRLTAALDTWFGRHLDTFSPDSFDVIEAGNHLAGLKITSYKATLLNILAQAIAESDEFQATASSCSPREIAQVLFWCGLTWKEGHDSRADFSKKLNLCVRATCPTLLNNP